MQSVICGGIKEFAISFGVRKTNCWISVKAQQTIWWCPSGARSIAKRNVSHSCCCCFFLCWDKHSAINQSGSGRRPEKGIDMAIREQTATPVR